MKKRNRVLEAILCAALAVVVFWGYMLAARDNGVFALEDIEGPRTACICKPLKHFVNQSE